MTAPFPHGMISLGHWRYANYDKYDEGKQPEVPYTFVERLW